jgi:hypothetical protein
MKIILPDNWDEVTLGQFQEIALSDGEDRMLDIISILSDGDPDELRKMDPDSFARCIEALAWVKGLPESGNYKPIIEVNGERYGFVNRMSDLTVGEWIDLESWMGNSNENMHKIIALLYRPLVSAVSDSYRVIDKYVAAESAERSKLFQEHVKIGDVYGAMLFFSLIEQEFIKITPKYLREKERMMKIKKLPRLKRVLMVLRGCVISIVWPKEKSQKWMRFLNKTFSSLSMSGRLKFKTNH